MTIRALKTSESGFLAEMLYEAIFVPEGYEPLPRDIIRDKSLSKYIDNWGKDIFDIALVMEDKDQPVGAIWGRLLTKENKGFGYLNDSTPELSMAVKEDYRSQGIGTKLLTGIADAYQKIGVEYLSLSVDKTNRASKLYRHMGYEIAGETETSWTMKKRINPVEP